MEMELLYRPYRRRPGTLPCGSIRLAELRRKAEPFRQAAQEAVSRGLSDPDPEGRLRNLRNVGGQ
jgi:hypothetical protein